MLGLASYDVWKKNTQPDLVVDVQSGSQLLLSSHFTDPSQSPVETSIYFEDVQNPNQISFSACCTGEASVVFGASFVPNTTNPEPINRGIQVQRIIQLLDPLTNTPTGGPITEASLGQQVVTTIEITLVDYSPMVVVVDPFPGALEPLDDSIYNVPSTPIILNYWYYYLYNAFTQREFLSDKVVFYGQNLLSGTYTIQYYSLVNTEGSFILSPTLAYDAFQPEVMGLSGSANFSSMGFVPPSVSNSLTSSNACLPWMSRNLTPQDLAPYLGTFNYSGEPSYTQAVGEVGSLAPVALGIGLSICLTVIIGLAASGVWFYRYYYFKRT